MGKGKSVTLFRIYQAKVNEHNVVLSSRPTKAVFKKAEEAKKYCNYLNNPNNYGGTQTQFYFVEDNIVVFNKATELIVNQEEDAILFS